MQPLFVLTILLFSVLLGVGIVTLRVAPSPRPPAVVTDARPDDAATGSPKEKEASEPEKASPWSFYRNPALGYQIGYPSYAKLIRPTWGTIAAEHPSDLIVKFSFDPECLDQLGRDMESTYVECPGEAVDIVFLGGQVPLEDLVEADVRKLGRARDCTTMSVIFQPIIN